MIKHSRLLEILEYSPKSGEFTWRVSRGKAKKGGNAGHVHHTGYLVIRADKRGYLAHRLAWFYVYGEWPSDQIDHINCDPLDNRISNLRNCKPYENSSNLKTRRNGLKGAVWSKRAEAWRASIKHKGKNYHLGCFSSEEAAHKAYCDAAKRLHGEFWRAA